MKWEFNDETFLLWDDDETFWLWDEEEEVCVPVSVYLCRNDHEENCDDLFCITGVKDNSKHSFIFVVFVFFLSISSSPIRWVSKEETFHSPCPFFLFKIIPNCFLFLRLCSSSSSYRMYFKVLMSVFQVLLSVFQVYWPTKKLYVCPESTSSVHSVHITLHLRDQNKNEKKRK